MKLTEHKGLDFDHDPSQVHPCYPPTTLIYRHSHLQVIALWSEGNCEVILLILSPAFNVFCSVSIHRYPHVGNSAVFDGDHVIHVDSIQLWTTEFMVVASSHLETTIPEPLPEFSHAVPDSEVLELLEVLEVL